MKKSLSVLLFVCIFAAVGSFFCCAADAPITIAIPADSTPQEQYAAETLQRYLGEMLGAEPAVMTGEAEGAVFAVGRVMPEDTQTDALPAGSYRIVRQDGGTIRIRGTGGKGNLNGVYAFLRDYCGCHSFAADVTVVPHVQTLSLPDTIDVTYSPYFEYTDTDWRSARSVDYALANGLNGRFGASMSAEQGGSVNYLYGFCHTLSTRFCARDTYFETHPEYFALHDGERSPNQLCLTNPDVLAIVTREVLDVAQTYRDPDADVQIISVTQDDNGDYCECDACKALDDANGSHAGTMVTFANAIACAVKQAGYDNILIDTFAYQYTRKPPTQVVPEENVVIRLCSIECCFCHTLDDPRCRENREFMDDLRGWNEICKRIYVWDYTTNYWETICLYPDFGVLQRNMQLFYENHVRGVFEEGNAADDCDAEFTDLRCYLLARLMQDPYMDYDAEMRAFLDAYYGEAGKNIYAFLTRVTEKAGLSYTSHLGTFPDSRKTLTRFTCADVRFADDQWAQAKQASAGTEYYARVERSELCWRYWKCTNYKGEFSPLRHSLYQCMLAKETLYNDLVRMGVRRINDTRRLRLLTDCRSIILLRPAGKWCELYENVFWDKLTPFAERLYDFLRRLETPIYVV